MGYDFPRIILWVIKNLLLNMYFPEPTIQNLSQLIICAILETFFVFKFRALLIFIHTAGPQDYQLRE